MYFLSPYNGKEKEHIQHDHTHVHDKQPNKSSIISIHTSLPEAETYIVTHLKHTNDKFWLFNMSPIRIRSFGFNLLHHLLPCALRANDVFAILKRKFAPVSHNRDLNNILVDSNSWKWMLTWMKPLPTIESLQMLQKKPSLCQASVSKATNFVLPSPPLPRKESKG